MGTIGVHLNHSVVASLERNPEPVSIGSPEALFLLAMQNANLGFGSGYLVGNFSRAIG